MSIKMKSIKSRNFMNCVLKCLLFVGLTKAQLALKICSRDSLLNCPSNSLCTQISNSDKDALKCVCLENFHLNPSWMEYENLNASVLLLQEHYCLSADEVQVPKKKENKFLNYIRSPARRDHLAFGILMVLLAAALAVAVLYVLKILKPLKRTKSMYQKLKYKRRNIAPLQEMDELELSRRYEMQIL